MIKIATIKNRQQQTQNVLKGNIAAALAAKLCRVTFVTAYPITPQTTIVEEISSMVESGEFDADSVNMESEHSVFAAIKGASLTGERVFTATSGQGLLYAHEVLHAIAHLRLPIVACNVGRPSYPWNIWCDHTDSISQRDTGWIQFYCENSQEVLDTIIQSYKIAEQLLLPVLVIIDAFYLSHTSENVLVPEQKLVDDFLPPRKITYTEIDVAHPKAFGGLVAPDMYDKFNEQHWKNVNKTEDETISTGDDFGNCFGRKYEAVEAVNVHAHTKIILVTMATIATTIRGLLPLHPEVGLLKIRLFKPFPKKSILKILKQVSGECVIVNLDRNFLGDYEGALMQEMKRALFGAWGKKMFGIYVGVGGRDVPPETIEKIIKIDFHSPETNEIIWIDK